MFQNALEDVVKIQSRIGKKSTSSLTHSFTVSQTASSKSVSDSWHLSISRTHCVDILGKPLLQKREVFLFVGIEQMRGVGGGF